VHEQLPSIHFSTKLIGNHSRCGHSLPNDFNIRGTLHKLKGTHDFPFQQGAHAPSVGVQLVSTLHFSNLATPLEALYDPFDTLPCNLRSGSGLQEYCRNPNFAKCGGEAQHLEKLGIWSPPGLPNVQSSTAGPKRPRIGVFLVSLERS